MLSELYRSSLALLTDLYQLTMACAYFRAGVHQRQAAFHLTFRRHPFGGGFTVAAGLATAVEYLQNLRFEPADLEYLASLRGNDGRPLFDKAFLDFLAGASLLCDVDAIPEGTIVFPHEPLLRVIGPIWQAQLVETALLNIVNFQTLVATKAARVTLAAQGQPVIEFGLRRAQGIDGGVSASRAAYIGGCAATSNMLAGRLLGIPVRGTLAHSLVMCFDTELEAFRAYATAMPNNCVFLVDTYNTLQGVRNAIEVGQWLRQQGHEMIGIRLDSGDLAWLSRKARELLDQAGFAHAAILASNDLDEHLIASLKQQGAAINAWGVGTRLATAFDQPALEGVYKLSAVRGADGQWLDRIKLSEQAAKTTDPGVLQVRRFFESGQAVGDAIYDVEHPPAGRWVIVDPADSTRRKDLSAFADSQELLTPIFRAGRCVYQIPSLDDSRRRTLQQLELFHDGIKRFVNPHQYPAGLELGLHQRKMSLILKARGFNAGNPPAECSQ